MQSYARAVSTIFMVTLVALGAACSGGNAGPSAPPAPEGTGGSSGSGGNKGTGGGSASANGGQAGASSQGGNGGSGSGGSAPAGSGGAQADANTGTDAPGPDPDEPPDAAPPSDTSGPGADAPPSGPPIAGCELLWSPSPKRDGEGAFELFEMPDVQLPGGSGPTHGGVKHITVVDDPARDAYRIDSHYASGGPSDFDRVTLTGPTRTDRLRCETRGMRAPDGKIIDMLKDENWRMTWQFFIPSSLKGTSRFTHIMQLKYVDKGGGVSGSPIITLTLRPNDRMELLLWLGGGSVSIVDAANLHDKWLTADLTMKTSAAGNLRWVLKDGDKVIVDKTQNGVIWPSDAARLRPKWGIYRGVTAGVGNTYMMLSDLRAYKCQ